MEVHPHPKVGNKNFKEYRKDLFVFLFPLSFYQTFSQNPHNNDIATIKSNRAASNDAIARHDVDGIAKFRVDDFVQVIGRGVYQTGKDSIIASWKVLSKAIHKSLISGTRKKLRSAIMILLHGNEESGLGFILIAKVTIMQRCGLSETKT